MADAKVLIIVRTLTTHEPEDELDEEWVGPAVPEDWELTRQGSTGWFTVRRNPIDNPDRFVNLFWVRNAANEPMMEGGYGVFAVCSDDIAALRWLRDNVPFAYTIKEIRLGVTAVASRVRDAWLDGRSRDEEGTPNPAQEAVALWGTMAGFDYQTASEDTEPTDIDE